MTLRPCHSAHRARYRRRRRTETVRRARLSSDQVPTDDSGFSFGTGDKEGVHNNGTILESDERIDVERPKVTP